MTMTNISREHADRSARSWLFGPAADATRRAAMLGALGLSTALATPLAAFAQTAPPPGRLIGLEQAAPSTPAPPAEPPWLELAAAAGAAALGGFIGARLAGGGRRERVPAPPPAPRYDPPPGAQGLGGPGASLSAGARANLLQDAERLFDFFQTRFGLRDTSADGAIDYLTRLSDSIDTLRGKLADAEHALDERPTAEELAAAGRVRNAASADRAPAEIVADGLRALRSAQSLLRADADYLAFSRETGLDDTLRPLAALRSAEAIDRDVIEEAWPHRLFRAEALSTFYPNDSAWRDLRFGLATSAAGVRLLLRAQGVFVDHGRIMHMLDPEEAEIWSQSAEGLRDLVPIVTAARAALTPNAPDLVIDYESFGYEEPAQGRRVRSKVIVFDPDEWL